MGKKLVWVDDSAIAAAAMAHANASGFNSPPDDGHKAMRAALESLPSALLIGAEEREELWAELASALAQIPPERRTGDVLATVVWDSGWRKVVAVDREALIEAIAAAVSPVVWMALSAEGRERYKSDAHALLARVEGESHV